MRELHIDIETFCNLDLTEVGVYRYVADESFEIILFGYAFDNEPSQIIDLANGEVIPEEVRNAVTDKSIIKKAHNANFERTCLSKYFNAEMRPEEWRCSAIRASQLGLPRSLKDVGDAIGLAEDEKKLRTGKALITYFCKPCKPTQSNNQRTRNTKFYAPEKWELFKEYCKQDVETERFIDRALARYPATTEEEHKLWCLDQRINELGVMINQKMVSNILRYNDIYRFDLTRRAKEITGLQNPDSLVQVKAWLHQQGVMFDSLTKDDLTNLLKDETIRSKRNVYEFLLIRKELGKTSVAKYEAMSRALCPDGRVHGMLQFYGANRTGRWAGRIVQLQNLPQNHLDDLEEAINLVINNDFEMLDILYPSIMDVLSQLIRTAFIAREGHTFVVCDYSAIEARVIGWLANEKWVLEVFNTTGKIYEATASQMYSVPVTSVTKGSDYRKKGKIATLACGYGGGIGALTAMDSKGEFTDDEKKDIILKWRNANPNIVKYWKDVEESAINAVMHPGSVLRLSHGVEFEYIIDTLFIRLPNGRQIAYKGAQVEKKVKYNKIVTTLTYMGNNQKTSRYERVETYGGKMVENIVQATARDILGKAMLELDKRGYRPQFHVHDEVIIEVPKERVEACMDEIKETMALKEIAYLKGLILKAEGYSTDFYKKD